MIRPLASATPVDIENARAAERAMRDVERYLSQLLGEEDHARLRRMLERVVAAESASGGVPEGHPP